jgi:cation diffusion facilitator CzcD-associated flavoprotein CzcO
VSATQDASTSRWHIVVKRGDGSERSFEVKHVVFATGFGDRTGAIPTIPGMVGPELQAGWGAGHMLNMPGL